MKELSIIKQMVADGQVSQEVAEKYFPELKESKDERIRKDVISFVEQAIDAGYGIISKERKEEWINWLEKQGEQMSVDKIEPKFKVGDWVVYGDEDVDLITGLCDKGYEVNDCAYIPFGCEDDMRYWSIQDAKKGDILSYDKSKCIAMFLKIENVSFKDICFIGAIDGKFHIGGWHDIENAHPATKEQRDLLFTKMKEASYEWDFNNKELKKIECETAWSKEDEDMLDTLIADYEFLSKRYRDEEHDFFVGMSLVKEDLNIVNWLKSLKERVGCEVNCTTTREWSEEDKGYLLEVKCVIDEVWHNKKVREEIGYSCEELETLWHWLDNIWQKVDYPQGIWKPSKDQMATLWDAICTLTHDGYKCIKDIESLYQDLKKLKG